MSCYRRFVCWNLGNALLWIALILGAAGLFAKSR